MFYRLISAGCVAAGLLAAPVMADTAAPVVVKAEDYVRDPDISPPRISPDGKSLAYVQGNRVVVLDIATEAVKTVDGGTNRLGSVEWINNDLLAAYIQDSNVEGNVRITNTRFSPLVISRAGKVVRLLFESGKKGESGVVRPIVRFVDGPEPYALSLGANQTILTDVTTGKMRPGPRFMDGQSHLFDATGRERVSVEAIDGKPGAGLSDATVRYRADGSDRVSQLRLGKQKNIYYLDFLYAEGDNAIYWTEYDASAGTAAIQRFDMATAARSVFRGAVDRKIGVLVDRRGKAAGVVTLDARPQIEWNDPYVAKLADAVAKIFPDASVIISDIGDDRSVAVLRVSGPQAPDSYYEYNAATKELTQIGASYPELDGRPLARMSYVTYKARDGLDIPAYVTKLDTTPKNAPLIVMPHGGPAARDVYGFDGEVQFFAAKGYVVLQPQYRGSAGFGDDFRKAGKANMARMATDLEDGVRYLAGQGIVDARKVCIVGWQWGGYLAEAGLTLTPDTYACGVAGNGVSDLFDLLGGSNWSETTTDYLRGFIGEPMRDGAAIHAASPIEHVDAVKAPLLLFHGELTPVISYHQSENMAAAMKKAGKAVTYVPLKFMWREPTTYDEKLQVLKATDDFVAKAFAQADKTR